jgi:hypothetical protein
MMIRRACTGHAVCISTIAALYNVHSLAAEGDKAGWAVVPVVDYFKTVPARQGLQACSVCPVSLVGSLRGVQTGPQPCSSNSDSSAGLRTV